VGFLSSLKRWFNQRDAYGQLSTFNRRGVFISRDSADRTSRAMYNQFNAPDEDGDPSESLADVELDSHTL